MCFFKDDPEKFKSKVQKNLIKNSKHPKKYDCLSSYETKLRIDKVLLNPSIKQCKRISKDTPEYFYEPRSQAIIAQTWHGNVALKKNKNTEHHFKKIYESYNS